MIVRQFLAWIRTASSGERAEATSALARAYLWSDLSAEDRRAAEGAMVMLLDDPSPLVREALADALAGAEQAPPAVIHGLLNDRPDIACKIIERSPLLMDVELVDAVARGEVEIQVLIAGREEVSLPVAAALAEIGDAEACLVLLENPGAELTGFSLERLVERFGDLAALREALLERPDLSAELRQQLVLKLARSLAGFVSGCGWLKPAAADAIVRDACEKATISIVAGSETPEAAAVVGHLARSGQLNSGFLLRALVCGNRRLFELALAELSGVNAQRVSQIVADRRGTAFRALYERAGLPRMAWPAFAVAVEVLNRMGATGDGRTRIRIERSVVEAVLEGARQNTGVEAAPLIALLQRLRAEAVREEARAYCADLVGSVDRPPLAVGRDDRLALPMADDSVFDNDDITLETVARLRAA